MKDVAPDRTETALEDFKGAYTARQAQIEAHRCLFCSDAPCVTACPTAIDVPQFIRKIATGNIEGAARTIFEANIFGMSCARVCPVEVLCVGDCVLNEMGVPPIQIGKLQRHATDVAFGQGHRFFEAGPDTGKTVGLLGGGPASLACAHELRRHGHGCVIYEKRQVLGGLNTWGVAPYKMKADRAEEEVRWILEIGGIEVKKGIAIPEDLPLAELESRHDAVFIGMGLGSDRHLDVPGRDLPGVEGAVDWIERMKLGEVSLNSVHRAVVVGGGNTAIDCVRELLQLGVEDVVMAYRRTEADMSGYAHEWAAARAEGARVLWRVLPVAYEGGGRVESVRLARLDASRKPIAGEELELQADLVLIAIGQKPTGELLSDLGIDLEGGCVVVDDHGATTRPGWYAGGDCANGGKEVVNAAAEGKRAARAIHRYLTEGAGNHG